ncbi:TonB-dependent siderophore receptor [Luteolibacter flavescens]|uniref:TonB-dependent siderophore receptor n=1 Tax=Luteolibacter flavescens TaxID=1859460 RepID=A0ABT3FVE4_9BACT|nr:TonB-dependent siderophore receptor [Luteolibacter flavescens]MCW1887535.1 TonB-dependent siderophore receptor [Luteolibacter flavescens]
MKQTRNNPTPSRVAMLLAAGFTTVTVSAQTTPAREPDATTNLSQLVVTADNSQLRYRELSSSAALFADTPLLETPFSVSVFNQQLIEDQRAFSLKEVLENEPSVAVQMPGGFYGTQNLSLRGFTVDNFNGYRVDGLPMIQTVSPYLDDKSRVEVLKGPAALRYGFMPPGGAINLVRKRPTEELSTSLQFDVNTFGRMYSQLDVSDTVANGQFGYRLVLAGDEFDSFYDNAGGDRQMGSLFTQWKPTETVTIWSSLSTQDLTRNGYYGPMISANGLVLDTGVKTNIMQDWARNEQESYDVAIGADIDFNEDWKLRASVNYQESDRESRLSYPYSVQDDGTYTEGALLTNGPFEWDSWGAHVHLQGTFNTGSLQHDIVIGSQYRSYDSYGERSFPDVGPNDAYRPVPLPIPAPGPWRAIDFEYEELGFFVTDTIKFTEQWSAMLGARYGRYENTYPSDPASNDTVSDWSPTAALMYAPVEQVHAYLTYTKGLQDGGFAGRTAANAFAPLGVQESEQVELGVKTDWCDGRFSGELAVFQIEQDLAMIDPVSNIAALSGLQRHRGVELALRGRITDEWQAGVATMLLDAEQVDTGSVLTSGRTPQYVPEYQVNLWSVLDIPQVPGLALTAGVRFVDGQYLDQQEQFKTGSYSVVDVGARYKFRAADTDWTLRVNVQNLLDERYYESGEFYPGDAGYLAYGSPIGANFSVKVDF